ncbi:hypothetical protein Q5424_14320 [Conexibacter sp. JD483]|jgi:hypothetical protein|nr:MULTISPECIES: hypothetical protein [unclassified Conexibacter]MDO8186286.1 hypothetical protein [Conexibacter sp. CPCC 205706]MDO8197491.1 hypothetical protein [Conexibacter sp. CPCC 205762]MDR9370274.1 hypothetical protein [Conexibacter sp. JD483]
MRETLNHVLSTPVDIGWKVLTVLTLLSTLEMTRNLLRRVRHIFP